jgi:hypothetical protein
MKRARIGGIVTVTVALATTVVFSCVEPPPKMSLPPGNLALKVYVFGASAQEARRAFDYAKQNNPGFSIVHEGGDGEVLVGLEKDSPACLPPTALCSFKVVYRVRNYRAEVVHTGTAAVSANSERCADLCEKAINDMVVKVVEAAASALHPGSGGAAPEDGGDPDSASTGVLSAADAAEPEAAASTAPPPPPARTKRPPTGSAKKKEPPAPVPAKPPPPICAAAAGPRLPSEEAERRAKQIEVLKRISVLDQDEYDCLRKAYLDRL